MIVAIYDFVYLRKKYKFEDVEYPLHNNKSFLNRFFGTVGLF